MGKEQMSWIDGKPGESLSVADRGLAYGDGLFETIAVVGGRARLLSFHLHRLRSGAKRLAIALPATLETELGRAIAAAPPRAVLKLIVTRGDGGRGYDPGGALGCRRVIRLLEFPPDYERQAKEGLKAEWARTKLAANPRLAGLKTLNRLEQVLARLNAPAADELIMGDYQGNAVEAVAANLFMLKDGSLHTPDLAESGVEGVMRRFILENCRKVGLKAEIRPVALAELASADELFVSNALRGIHPLVELSGRSYPIGEPTRKLQELVAELAERQSC